MPAVAEPKKERTAKAAPKSALTIKKSILLRCMAYRVGDGRYVAECIDLDLMVVESSADLAMESLRESVHGYLQVVLQGDDSGLLPRLAPFSHRLRYHWYCLLAAIVLDRNFRIADCTSACSA